MNRLRILLFVTIVVFSSATLALGGDIQGPGKSDPAPSSTPNSITTASTSDGLTQPTSIDEDQIVRPDTTAILVEILLAVF